MPAYKGQSRSSSSAIIYIFDISRCDPGLYAEQISAWKVLIQFHEMLNDELEVNINVIINSYNLVDIIRAWTLISLPHSNMKRVI